MTEPGPMPHLAWFMQEHADQMEAFRSKADPSASLQVKLNELLMKIKQLHQYHDTDLASAVVEATDDAVREFEAAVRRCILPATA